MQKYILNRLLQGIVLLFIVALIVFALARATGNPADLMVPEDATEEERQFIERNLGLDRPYHVQLFVFLTGIVRGDFGDSLVYKKPAAELFFERLANTLKLLPLSMFIAVGVAIPLGVVAAIKRGTWDRSSRRRHRGVRRRYSQFLDRHRRHLRIQRVA